MNLVEQIGSGIKRIRDLCRDYGVAEPGFDVSENWFTVAFPRVAEAIELDDTPHVTDHVTDHVIKFIGLFKGEMSRDELMAAMGLKHRIYFTHQYLRPALKSCLIEMTIPDKPRSINQRYRLTEKGKETAGKL